MSMLEVSNLAIAFGGVHAVQGVTFSAGKGELLGLIGPNGAGKTTLLRLVSGVLRPDVGSVRLNGRDITRLPLHRRAAIGCVLTHQIVRPFRDMTLLENVMLPAARSITATPWRALLSLDTDDAQRRALALLDRLGIADAAHKLACTVPLGYLKRMQVARALALEPSLLLLDEPLAGLNYVEASKVADMVVELNAAGLTILLVEHNLGEVTRIAKRLLVLHGGNVLADGEPRDVMARQAVRDAYLGTSAHA